MKKIAYIHLSVEGRKNDLDYDGDSPGVVFDPIEDTVKIDPSGSLVFIINGDYTVYAPGTWASMMTNDYIE